MLPLTKDRAKPAVPFGGSYRIIDFALSNFANAALPEDRRAHPVQEPQPRPPHQPDVAVQHAARQLRDARCRRRCAAARTGSPVRPTRSTRTSTSSPTRTPTWCACSAPTTSTAWIRGRWSTSTSPRGAGVTVAAIPVRLRGGQGVRRHRGRRRRQDHGVPREVAAPAHDARRRHPLPGQHGQLRVRHQDAHRHRHAHGRGRPAHRHRRPHHPGAHRAGRGARVRLLARTSCPGQDDREKGYWRDVGTIDSYYDANMDLLAPVPVFNLYNDDWPVFTSHELAAAGEGVARRGRRAVVRRRQPAVRRAPSCRAATSSGRSSSPGVRVHHDAHVTDSILFPGVTHRRRRPAQPVHHRQERRGARPARASASTASSTPSASPSATVASSWSRRAARSAGDSQRRARPPRAVSCMV